MKNLLYKLIIKNVTNYCYENSLDCFQPNTRILDVGIGNGVMLENFHHVIKTKNLKITGIDINKSYLKHCKSLIDSYHLEDYIEIYHEAVENYSPPENDYFDFVLFSMSFMLFKNQQLVLDLVKNWIKPDGNVLFFQTMYKDKFKLMEIIKPKLKHFTTIDFGSVTYENDFFKLLDKNHMTVSEDRMIKQEWFKGQYRMLVTSFNGSPS
jgi:ubiquinone/menaquinone biosynthesis C-methylase UbiE